MGNRTAQFSDGDSSDTLDAGDTSVTLYQWDHRNRLVKHTFQANYGTDYRILTYEYDTFDRRVAWHALSLSTGLPIRSSYWIWDGQQMALQFSDGDGAGASAPAFQYRFLSGPGIDQVFNQESNSDSNWLLADHLGTTRDVVDDSGTLQRHNVFDAYGNLQGSGVAYTRILFAGRELDPLTGLYYVRARWYDPAVGRWVSEDPIGFAGGDTNLSRYVANSPVNYTDPSGLEPGLGGILPRPIKPKYTPDEQRLIALARNEEERRQILELIDLLRETVVWPIATNRCHAWRDAFEDGYKDRNLPWYLDPEEPYYSGPMPWEAHSVMLIVINGEKVYLDRQLQGGSDHICFDDGKHPDLHYFGSEEFKRRDKEANEKYQKRLEIIENMKKNPPFIPLK